MASADTPGNLVADDQGGNQLLAIRLVEFRQSKKRRRNGFGDVDAPEIQAILDFQQGAQHRVAEGGVALWMS